MTEYQRLADAMVRSFSSNDLRLLARGCQLLREGMRITNRMHPSDDIEKDMNRLSELASTISNINRVRPFVVEQSEGEPEW